MIRPFIAALIAALAAAPALGQPVTQGGQVTPNHPTMWTTNGIIGDAGTSDAGGLTTLGITSPGTTPFCINNGSVLAGPYSALCLGINPTSGATLTVQAFGGATPLPLNFNMNGNLSSFSIGANGVPTFSGPTASSQLILGAAPNNVLTLTPGATSSSPVTFVQSGTGGYTFDQNVTVPTLSVGGAASFGSINGTPIGNTTPSTGAFTTLGATGAVSLTGSGTGLAVTNNALILGISTITTVAISDNAGTPHLGAASMTFPTRAALLAFQPNNVGTSMITATTAGRTASGDGGGLTYSWVAGSSTTVSDPFVLQPNSPGGSLGRWIVNLPTGGMDIRASGAKCDGTTDDSTVVNTMYSNATTAGLNGRQFTAVVPFGVACYVGPTTQVIIRSSMGLRCLGNPYRSTQSGGAITINGIILATTATLQNQGTVDGCFISSFGLSTLPANMEAVVSPVSGQLPSGGTNVGVSAWAAAAKCAITIPNGTNSVVVRNVLIIGFNEGICSTSSQRPLIENVQIDSNTGIDVQVVGDTGVIRNAVMDPFWSQNLNINAAVIQASLVGGSAGTGGTPGAAVLTLQATGPTQTCSTLPQFDVVIGGGGSISSITDIKDVGDCTTVNGPSAGVANPFAVTGGGLSGATLSLTWFKGKQRSGDCVYLHNQGDSMFVSEISCEGWHNGIHLQNVWDMTIDKANLEVGSQINGADGIGDVGGNGIFVDGSACSTRITNVYASSDLGTSVYVDDSGTCSNGAAESVSFTNLQAVSGVTGSLSQGQLNIVAGSTVNITNLNVVTGAGNVNTPSMVIGANVALVNINNVNSIGGYAGSSTQSGWYSLDHTSSATTFITTGPNVRTLTSGASATALCNDTIYVSDTTAPTITMPLSCPQGQNVLVKDAGNDAAAHNITLQMPSGSTINGGSSGGTLVLSTNSASANVAYNGLNAYTR